MASNRACFFFLLLDIKIELFICHLVRGLPAGTVIVIFGLKYNTSATFECLAIICGIALFYIWICFFSNCSRIDSYINIKLWLCFTVLL